jgi:hypothetical protein
MATAIIATFNDELEGITVERELGMLSEFFSAKPETQAAECQRWADDRGNKQHETILTFVSWVKK